MTGASAASHAGWDAPSIACSAVGVQHWAIVRGTELEQEDCCIRLKLRLQWHRQVFIRLTGQKDARC